MTRVRRVLAVVGTAVLVAGCAADEGGNGGNDASNEGWTPEYVDGVLQPLPDGFPSDPLVLVNPDEPGHDDGLYARAMQSALDGISPVPIEVQDQAYPTFGTWAGIQYLQDQPGGTDGYYAQVAAFVGSALDLLTEPIEDEFGMGLDDINPVIATELTPFVMVVRADGPWQSYEDLVTAAQESPGELRYMAASGSQLDIAMQRVMSEGDWTAEAVPNASSSDAATAVAAGEGDFTMLTPSVARNHQEAGTVRVLLVISPNEQPPAGYEEAVTTAGIGLPDEPWGSQRGFMVAPETPQAHKEWLFELFRAGSEQPPMQERIDNLPGSEIVTLGPDEIRTMMEDGLEFSEPIIRDLGLLHE